MALTLANKVTIVRILTAPLFIAAILYYSQTDLIEWRYAALGIFLFAVTLDVIDGYIARTRHQKTRAGAILDPLADKILLISAFVCLYLLRQHLGEIHFPVWLVVAVISRDAILVVGSTIIFMAQGELEIEPSRWGKTTTFFQVFCVVGVLLQWEFSLYVWIVTIVSTLISGLGYIKNGIKVLNTVPAK